MVRKISPRLREIFTGANTGSRNLPRFLSRQVRTVRLQDLRGEPDGEGKVLGDDGPQALLRQGAVSQLATSHRRPTEGVRGFYNVVMFNTN